MPLRGIDKNKRNFLNEIKPNQWGFWPNEVKRLDEEANGRRFRSELLSYSDLWKLYSEGTYEAMEISEEDEARGKKPEPKKKSKKDREYDVIPIDAFELPGRYHHIARNQQGEPYHTKPGWGYLTFPEWLYARDQARKDLFWLCKEVFGLDVIPRVHQAVCDQFVQKDFDGVFKEGYTSEDFKAAFKKQNRTPRTWLPLNEDKYDNSAKSSKMLTEPFGMYIPDPNKLEEKCALDGCKCKEKNLARTMILLDPRGFFKSSIDAIDCISWMINAPDARILIVTGVIKLAEQFLNGMIKPRLFLAKGRPGSTFHLLFPEYILRGVEGTSREPIYYHNLRTIVAGDPNLGIISVGSNLAGFHCDVLKFDDIVTEENCLTDDTRQAIRTKANGARNLLMSWGWQDIIGTRYFPDDYYGETIDVHRKTPDTFNLKLFKRAVWTIKKEFQHIEDRNLSDITESMVELVFPENNSFKHLTAAIAEDQKLFRCQQLNQPVWGDENPAFTHTLLMESLMPPMQAHKKYPVESWVGAIDLAREDKRYSDFTCIAVGKLYQDIQQPLDIRSDATPSDEKKWRLVVLDVEFGKWGQAQIADKIAAMNEKWRPHWSTSSFKTLHWYGEEIGGLELLKARIAEVAKDTYGNWPLISWFNPDNSVNAKVKRIKGMEILLRDKRMFFSMESWINSVFEQLEKYVGQKSSRSVKDDVPDALSILAKNMPQVYVLSPKEKEALAIEQEKQYQARILRMQKDRIFGESSGGFGMDMNYPRYPQMGEEPQQPQSNDPISKYRRSILGGGAWR